MSFSSAHFVVSGGVCEALHGHNYAVEVVIAGALDELGMVLDFRVVKNAVAKVCKTLDHKILLPGHSPIIELEEEEDSIIVYAEGKTYRFPSDDCKILPIHATTAELLAEYIFTSLGFPTSLKVSVCVSESVGSTACFSSNEMK